jgi:glycosyltransferase involved in cell wall biosynthesis
MRILFLVRSLEVGGAERQLVLLARGLARRGHEVSVAVFYAGGAFEADVRAAGLPLHDLRKRNRWETLPCLARLVRLVRATRPDVVHGYLGLANQASATVRFLFPGVKVVWGIRSAKDDLRAYGWLARAGTRVERLTSPLADAVIANSRAAARQAIASGVDARKVQVIPNGIDCQRFAFDPAGRARVRREWGVPDGAPLVGMVARLDPVKSHPTFLRAVARVAARRPDARFVCVGHGAPAYRARLERLAAELGAPARLVAPGATVTSAIYSALDVAVLSSNPGESFPNVLGEAMACGRPCVVTDSGDAREILGEAGAVVPPRDPDALAGGVLDVLDRAARDGGALSAAARRRVERCYSVDLLVRRTEAALEAVRQGAPRRRVRRAPGDADPARPLRVTHVITSVGSGGAQAMLHKLVVATRDAPVVHRVVTLLDGGMFAAALREAGVEVRSLGLRRGVPDPASLWRLARWLRRDRPDVVQSWLYHADLLAGLAAAAAGGIPVVWNVRHADVEPGHARRLTHWTRLVCARLSGVLPARIVCCGEAARRAHAALGYRADRLLVIPNGFPLGDLERDPVGGAAVRRELSLPDGAPVVGLLGRFDPDKDHRNFLAAAARVARAAPAVRFVLAGDGVDGANPTLQAWIEEHAGLAGRVRLLGLRQDVPRLLSALDVLALSSRAEAFPNVLGEAMACGVPCVATDCGDAREILGPAGLVVPPRDPAALADALLDVLARPAGERAALGAAGRARVRERYDVRAVARRYLALYAEVSGRGAAPEAAAPSAAGAGPAAENAIANST